MQYKLAFTRYIYVSHLKPTYPINLYIYIIMNPYFSSYNYNSKHIKSV